jgi:hypothetical protein
MKLKEQGPCERRLQSCSRFIMITGTRALGAAELGLDTMSRTDYLCSGSSECLKP